MTPAARLAAAIEILDQVLAGDAAGKAQANWARRSRFAGSKDRAAVRDHVFDALRCKRSFALLGGGVNGRGLVLGMLRARGIDAASMFTGIAHAPAALSHEETKHSEVPAGNAALDCPDWLAPRLKSSLGDDFVPVCKALQVRAPVFLRLNLQKATRRQAVGALAAEGIIAQPHPLSPTALEVVENPRRVHLSAPYRAGVVELQDVASQAVVDLLPLRPDMRVLDYCAGGGGKVLAMAGRVQARYFAHDAKPQRLKDLPERAKRAGAEVTLLDSGDLTKVPPFDLVLCDVPCSGSGAWRRSPEAKWALTEERLADLCDTQAEILARAADLTATDGMLAYVTCSLLEAENMGQIELFLRRQPAWSCVKQQQLTPLDGGDGFFCALLTQGKL